ncbi:MAG: glycine cleavage system aminomethyltransferase GcvT [Myxococcales bacterium]|nr:glycine cleavage system aminomethyltransferase GcvT [Myxococcales bacterium]
MSTSARPSTVRRTPLFDTHMEAGGRLVEFAGFQLPIQYASPLAEHMAVRTAAGLFDVSHMGELLISGPRALDAVQRLLSNDLARIADGQAAYTGLLNERGGFVDDVVAYRFSEQRFLLVVNAANVARDLDWIRDHVDLAQSQVQIDDLSDDYAQLALQGPASRRILARLLPASADLTRLAYYHFTEAEVAGTPCLLARTGYTGELGFELYCPPDRAPHLWAAIIDAGQGDGLIPCGLGARDSLRLEKRFALYGHDIDEHHTPLEAGLGWIVKLDKGDFIGRAALEAQKATGLTRKLVGFEVLGRGIARAGQTILADGAEIGRITSGAFSPCRKQSIGLAYVPLSHATIDATFDIDIRGAPVAARVVRTPFVETSVD